jgi:hypothetical protein
MYKFQAANTISVFALQSKFSCPNSPAAPSSYKKSGKPSEQCSMTTGKLAQSACSDYEESRPFGNRRMAQFPSRDVLIAKGVGVPNLLQSIERGPRAKVSGKIHLLQAPLNYPCVILNT